MTVEDVILAVFLALIVTAPAWAMWLWEMRRD